jgi:Flp pilus assembly protein TadG
MDTEIADPAESGEEEKERDGFVVIWFALLIVVLLGIAAFAVDLVHAYAEQQHVQNAADAAALAGAVEIPTDTNLNNATLRANDVAENDYNIPAGDITVSRGGVANELDVTIKKTFPTFFGQILGFKDLTVSKHGYAQFDPPAAMGSAVNHTGDVPVCPDMTTTSNACSTDAVTGGNPTPWIQKLWASIQGPDSDKVSGNAFTTTKCMGNTTVQMVDGCEPGNRAVNDEYNPNGETFDVKVPVGGSYDLWVYDPSMVNTQPNCGVTVPGIPGFDHASDWQASANPTYVTVGNNYYSDLNYCPGDTYSLANTLPSGSSTAMETDYQFLDPASGGTRNPDAACPATQQFPGFAKISQDVPALQAVLSPGGVNDKDGKGNDVEGPNAALDYENKTGIKSYFHQWYKLCTFNAPTATTDGNEYQVRVTSPSGQGTNQFALMVLPSGSSVGIGGSSVFARESLPLVAVNFNAGVTSNFYLARILPSSKTRTLQLSFFDLGDSSTGGKTGSLTVSPLATTGSNGTLTCTSTPAPSNASPPRVSPAVTPFPAASFTNSGCTVAYDAGSATNTWNGRWVSIDVTIPAATDPVNGYRCDTTQLASCWIQLGYTPAAGSTLSDATTWDAQLVGSPVRLVG